MNEKINDENEPFETLAVLDTADFKPMTAEQIEAEVLALLEADGDPLGLNPDADLLVERFAMLSREREEMCREYDEVINRYRVIIKKTEELRAKLTETIDADLSDLDEQVRELVLESKTNAAAGGYTFGYSETSVSDTKQMVKDSAKSPKLAAILSRYLSKRPTVSKRYSAKNA